MNANGRPRAAPGTCAVWAQGDALDCLRRWWPQLDRSVKSIAVLLGTSESAVTSVARRLGLPARPRFVPAPASWATDEAILRLEYEWARGTSTEEIGKLLGVSKGAIIGKLHRLGLPARPSPIAWGGRKAKPKRVCSESPAKRQATPMPVAAPLPPLPPLTPPAEAPRPVIAAPVRVAPPRIVVRRSGETCCWLGGKTRPYQTCDAPAFGRLPYCAEHAARTYTPGWRERQGAEVALGAD